MSQPAPSSRRLAIAISAAVASTTIAIGVTAASLLGWFQPATAAEPAAAPAPEAAPVIYVPVAPEAAPAPAPAPAEPAVQLVMHERDDRDHDDRDHDDRDHDDREEHDDD